MQPLIFRRNMVYESLSEKDTFDLGKKLGADAKPGQIVCIDGDLGVGKTVFTKGFAEGLGVGDDVVSPTFTIIQEYTDGRLPMYHFDVYRIGHPDEMYDIGYEEYFYGDGVCLVEWSSRIEELLPEESVHINIEKDLEKGFDYRKITVEE